jgi:hypothetical protein
MSVLRSSRTLAGVAMVALVGCGGGSGGTPNTPSSPATADERLSQTGLYSDIASKAVDTRNRPFTPQYVLWSDGGTKRRWISLPAGSRIDTTDMDRWVFPVGTKIWKEFTYQGRRVETRLTEKIAAEPQLASWRFKTFAWRPDESDATLVSEAGFPNAAPTAFNTLHDIPSVANCRSCHERGGDAVLAVDALQLSADRDPMVPPEGQLRPGDLTLADFAAQGLLTRNPDSQPRIVSRTPAGRWAMGYMHGNCGNCHNPRGSQAGLGLFLRHEIAATREDLEPAFATTVNQLNISFVVSGTRLGVDSYRIRGGSPEVSAAWVRMHARGDAKAMPPIASKVEDADATAILSDWIRRLSPP